MLFLACSGALTQNLLHAGSAPPASDRLPAPPPPAPQTGTVRTQLDAAATALDGRTPDLVVVSVGGNDAGFSGIGAMCLAPGHCDDEHAIWDSPGNFAQLQNQLEQVYAEIAQQFPSSAVVITPYPDPIDTDRDADCGDLLLTRSEVRFVHDFLLGNAAAPGLDGTIERTAKAHGFYYAAPMVTALHDEHLQLCDPTHGSPGIHFIGLRSIQGVAEQRFDPKNWLHSSLHPNERGHAALLHAFSGWYQQQLGAQIKAGTAVPSGDGYRLAARTASEPLQPLPYASIGCRIADDRHGCRAKASAWVRRESVDALLTTWAGPVLGLSALAGGVLAAAFTAWRRRRWRGAYVPFP
jgi:lysophospholipase L1-like esterase